MSAPADAPPPGGEPLSGSRFTVTLDGVPVAGVLRVSALALSASAGGPAAAPVTITRAAGTDDVFEAWARAALGGGDRAVREVVLTVLDAAGSPRLGRRLLAATPVAYSPVGELDARAPDLLTETLTLSVTDVLPV